MTYLCRSAIHVWLVAFAVYRCELFNRVVVIVVAVDCISYMGSGFTSQCFYSPPTLSSGYIIISLICRGAADDYVL